jgi:hypothetical protein
MHTRSGLSRAVLHNGFSIRVGGLATFTGGRNGWNEPELLRRTESAHAERIRRIGLRTVATSPARETTDASSMPKCWLRHRGLVSLRTCFEIDLREVIEPKALALTITHIFNVKPCPNSTAIHGRFRRRRH